MENATGPTVPNIKQSSPEDTGNRKVYVHLCTLCVNCRTWEHPSVPKSGYFLLSTTNYMDLMYQLLQSFTLLSTLRCISEQYIPKPKCPTVDKEMWMHAEVPAFQALNSVSQLQSKSSIFLPLAENGPSC